MFSHKTNILSFKIGIPLGKNLGFSARVEVFGPVRSSPIPASSGYTGPPFALGHSTNLYSTTLFQISSRLQRLKAVLQAQLRDRGATLRLGCTISDSILGGGGAQTFFSLSFYNFKNIGGGMCPPCPPLLRGPCN